MLMDVVPGQVLGRYELLMPVAQGGMAMVWAARLKGSRGFQKLVAIKTMLPSMIDDPNFEKMFLDEASLASEIHHPHVIEILDLGEQDSVLYLVMEWVDGEPLNVLMNHAAKQGNVPLRVAISLLAQACRGLHAAHELRDEHGTLLGLVHRDITPHNILVTYDGVVKIVDFGVAKATSRLAAETEAGQLKGKIAYMAPEQLRGEPVDRRTDVFALGIVLYMLLTGVHPFKADDQPGTIQNITSNDPARSIRKYVPGLSPALDAVVLQALAKDPAKRFPSANDLLKAITRVMQPSTDEEVAEYVRGLLQSRQEKKRRALRAALEIADQREEALQSGRSLAAEVQQDDVATIAEPRSRPSQTSDFDIEVPNFERESDESMPGAGADQGTTETRVRARLRTPAIIVGALLGSGVAAALTIGYLKDESDGTEANRPGATWAVSTVESLRREAVPSGSTEETQAPTGGEILAEEKEEPTADDVDDSHEEEDSADETDASAGDEPKGSRSQPTTASRRSSKPTKKPPTSSPAPSPPPFVTPVRDPGF